MSSLTKHPVGSVRELWSVAAPLMLSSFSLLAMIFIDRVFLAHYSASALSAAVTSGTAAWAVVGSLMVLAGMAEVFVAQYNGAELHRRIGGAMWQGMWFSVITAILTIPIALYGGALLFGDSPFALEENLYWKWFLLFGWTFPLQAALASFYIGRGKTKLVMLLAVVANLANVLLDWLLIFGVEGILAPQGVKGAAIATCTGNMLQVAILLVLVLRRKNRVQYGTGDYAFDLKAMGKLIRIGSPQGTLVFCESLGWAFFYSMIARVGPEDIFVAGACQSVVILFFFAAEGVGRGAAAISGNLIGAGRAVESFKVFRAGVKLHGGFFVVASLCLVVFPQPFVRLFLSSKMQWLSEHSSGLSATVDMATVEHLMQVGLQLCLFYLLFEGIRWLVSGILSAAGDTLFLLIGGIVTMPLFLLLPTYIFIQHMHYGVTMAFTVSIGFSLLTSAVFLWRLRGRRWVSMKLTA